MRKKNRKPPCHKIVLRLPDLDQATSGGVNSTPLRRIERPVPKNRLGKPSNKEDERALSKYGLEGCGRILSHVSE
jgi:hypothetical protein